MKLFGVLSDTHGSASAIDAALDRLSGVDAFIHLGDLVSDAEHIASRTGKPVHAVRGNCDVFSSAKGQYGTELVLEEEGVRILLVHGHAHEVDAYSTYAARLRALELGCGALFYGHTHIPQLVQRDGLILLNPGSPSRPRGGSRPSCALAELDGGVLRARVTAL